MFFILGSGPASVSCAVALANRGVPVTILDIGRTLEPEHRAVVGRMSRQGRDEWSRDDLDHLRRGDRSARQGSVHVKLSYGSAYPYSDPGDSLRPPGTPIDFHYSTARGGLSNVWGSSLLPNRAGDMAAWPVSLAELEPHYRAVHRFLPSSSTTDALAELLPTYTTRGEAWPSSRQAQAFLDDLQRHRAPLRRSGLHFGRSRMAVAVSGDAKRRPCNACGLCLYGCPYSLIYSSAQTLDELLEAGKITYLPGRKVEKLHSTAAGVRIEARQVDTGAPEFFDASRVFVGCGILPTASIVLHSLGIYDTPVPMLDSQYFIFPFFRLAKTDGVEEEALHSLCQAFLEIDDARVSRNLVHIEVFSYSDFLKQALMETPLRYLLKNQRLSEELLGRLLVLQCFLHSDDSSQLELELLRPEGAAGPRLKVTPRRRWRSLWTSLKAGLKLSANALPLGGLPVVPAMQFADPGRSYHSGGSFPMRAAPEGLQTDRFGELPALPRVHLIDASVFPSIPATSITLTVMANAHRIGTEVAS
ncbi:MAG TPA: GMC oxidoreductase [Chthoniobacteraceae bacterium]|nr:GMC oxidoreductase [Chthoniobacteraceae bacterium]